MYTYGVVFELPTQNALPPTARWSDARRFAVRFAFVYFVLYNLPFPLGAIPHTESLLESYNSFWHKVVPWVGKHALRLKTDITIFTNGSTDTTYDFLLILCFLAIALIAAIAWSFLDRSRPNYAYLNQWLFLYVRLSLGSAMLSYGAAKVFQQQFADPNWYQLLQPLGDYSRQSLLWMFMGSSHGYRYFTASVELVGGILLFVPRFRTLGALLGAAAFTNVFALNISYNVPVKMYALHFLFMSIFLLLPDAPRLVNVILLNRPTTPVNSRPLFRQLRLNRVALVLQVFLGFFLAASYLVQARAYEAQDLAARPPFYGIWKVEEFTFDGNVRPPLLTDDIRWQRMVIQYPKGAGIQGMSGTWTGYWLRRDMEKKTFAMEKPDDAKQRFQFSFTYSDPGTLALSGTDGQHAIGVRLHRVDEKEFTLLADHFQWIHEDADY